MVNGNSIPPQIDVDILCIFVDEFWPKTTLYLVVFPCIHYSIREVSQGVGYFDYHLVFYKTLSSVMVF